MTTTKHTLKFPNDRYNGFVALTGPNGLLFVPDFTRLERAPIEYCQAFMGICRALDQARGE